MKKDNKEAGVIYPPEESVEETARRHAPGLHEILVEKGELQTSRKHIQHTVQSLETASFETIETQIRSLIVDIEKSVSILQKRVEEVRQRNKDRAPCIDMDLPYFEYPADTFLKPFKKEVNACIRQKKVPNIGIIGYGSLQSTASADSTIYDPYTRESVVTYDLQRGLFMRHYSTHATRKDAFWGKRGATRHDETGEMAVRYKKDQCMNGVRLSNLSLQDIQNIMQREFPYFLMPCGPSYTDDGECRPLNLVCWPIGNYLTRSLKVQQWKRFINTPTFKREGHDSESTYDRDMFHSAHTLHYNGLKPDMHYVETCLDRGNGMHENVFLDTTFVPMPHGEPLSLREYLAKHAPANDETKREYFGPRLQKRLYYWDEEKNKWIVKKEIGIKTTQRPPRYKL